MVIFIKMDLALNNLQRLICHKTQPTNQPTVYLAINLISIILSFVVLDLSHIILFSKIVKHPVYFKMNQLKPISRFLKPYISSVNLSIHRSEPEECFQQISYFSKELSIIYVRLMPVQLQRKETKSNCL